MTSAPPQRAKIMAQNLVVFSAGRWSFRGPDRLPEKFDFPEVTSLSQCIEICMNNLSICKN